MGAFTRSTGVKSKGNRLAQGLENLFPSDQAGEIHSEYVLAIYQTFEELTLIVSSSYLVWEPIPPLAGQTRKRGSIG